jgi:hypothetical protein
MSNRFGDRALAALFAAVLSAGVMPVAIAQSPYSYIVNAVAAGPFACGPGGFDVLVSGSISWNLPTTPGNNLYDAVWLNGVTILEGSEHQSPEAGMQSFSHLRFGWADSVQYPYRSLAMDYPLEGGLPVGTGTRIVVQCNGENDGWFKVDSCQVGPDGGCRPDTIPTLPNEGLLVLGALLIAAAGWQLRRLHQGSASHSIELPRSG